MQAYERFDAWVKGQIDPKNTEGMALVEIAWRLSVSLSRLRQLRRGEGASVTVDLAQRVQMLTDGKVKIKDWLS